MKKLALIVALSVAALTSQAQSGRLSAGLELGLPVGDYADFNSLGIGVSARYEYPVADKIAIIGTAGYQSFAGKEYEISTPVYDLDITSPTFGQVIGTNTEKFKPDPTSIIPIQVGAKYYFNEAWNGLYGSAELGIHMFSGEGDSESKFGYAAGLGYCVTNNIDLGLRYQMIPFDGGFSFDYVGLRAAYVFGGK